MQQDKPFQVNEIAILVNTEVFPEYEHSEVVVVRALGPIKSMNSDTMQLSESIGYIVETKDGRRLAARPHQLKPRVSPPEVAQKEKASV